mgnify:CR=1 FL=1
MKNLKPYSVHYGKGTDVVLPLMRKKIRNKTWGGNAVFHVAKVAMIRLLQPHQKFQRLLQLQQNFHFIDFCLSLV